jgi:hypothetical protein
MSRHQPLNGADSPAARGPYVVLMESRFEEGERIEVRVAAAWGRHDAFGQAEFERPGFVALKAVAL